MPFVASLMLLSLGFAMIEVCRKYCLLFGDFSEYPLYPKFISFIFPQFCNLVDMDMRLNFTPSTLAKNN